MRYELKPVGELTEFDDMISATPAGVIVAVPTTTHDVIANLFAAGLVEGLDPVIEVTDVQA